MADGSTKLYNAQYALKLYRIKDSDRHSAPPPETFCCTKPTSGEHPFTPEPWDTSAKEKRKGQLEAVFQRRRENYKRFYEKMRLLANNEVT